MNDTQKSILARRSVRAYTDEQLTEAELQALADAALASPSAKNSQDWHFIFVTNRELLEAFSADFRAGMLAQASPERAEQLRNYDVLYHPPLLVLITLNEQPSSRFAEVDAGIAVENIALAAQGMGLGSVILGMPIDLFRSGIGSAWMKKLQFPEGHRFAIAISVGHPAMTKEAHPIGENKVTFIR